MSVVRRSLRIASLLALMLALRSGATGCATAPLLQPPAVPAPLGAAANREVILDTLLARQWLIEREEPGAFVVRHEKEDKHSATVRLEYDASEIRIAYVASENLDCTPEGESCREINRAYNRWVEQLERDLTIRVNHAAFRGVAAPAPAP